MDDDNPSIALVITDDLLTLAGGEEDKSDLVEVHNIKHLKEKYTKIIHERITFKESFDFKQNLFDNAIHNPFEEIHIDEFLRILSLYSIISDELKKTLLCINDNSEMLKLKDMKEQYSEMMRNEIKLI
jgi:hypothetical protein